MSRSTYIPLFQFIRLDHACVAVEQAFGGHKVSGTYLVGSAEQRPDWRDVDVRTILPDDEWDAIFKGRQHLWSLFCLAVSAYLSDASGLPVDYQVQRMTEANQIEPSTPRNPLGKQRLYASHQPQGTPWCVPRVAALHDEGTPDG